MHPRASSVLVSVFVCSVVAFAADINVFGPETFTRTAGPPRIVVRTFSVAAATNKYVLRVANNGVTNADIALNGRAVLRPDDFKTAAASIEQPVQLRSGTNTLTVRLRGKPGTSFTLSMVDTTPDTTPPTITTSVAPAPDANGWNDGPVTVTFTCSDAGSGVATCPMPVTVSTEGANQVITGTASDNAGNSASASATVNIDLTAPTITASLDRAPNASEWNNSPVLVSFTCSDAGGSGILTCPGPVPLTDDGAGQVVNGTATDKVGRTASASITVNIDQTPPLIAVALSTPPGPGGIFSTPVDAHFTCSDALSGVAACSPDQQVATEGVQQMVTGAVTDRAGNRATTTSAPFTIDLTPPSILVTLSASPNSAGWYNAPVTATFTCADSISGVAACPPPHIFSSSGANQRFVGVATDAAGHMAEATAEASIDVTPPSLVLTSPANGSILFTSNVTIEGSASDNLSGVAGFTCSIGQTNVAVPSLPCNLPLARGPNALSVVVKDLAGNATTVPLGLNYNRAPVVKITSPATLTYVNTQPTTITGTVDDPTAVVTVNSISAPLSGDTFTVPLPLAEGPNEITATASNNDGAFGTDTIVVTLDTTPPRVTIVSPSDHFVTTDDRVTVSGIINDIVVGTVNDTEATVRINGRDAVVANRTFLASDVPLSFGDNVIEAIGRDRVGNQFTTQIVVTRQPVTEPQIRMVSGNNQSGAIGSTLSQRLVIALEDALGMPVADENIIFKVMQNDGLVAGPTGGSAPTVIVKTDAMGQGSVAWTLGNRAGAGSNRVEAYAVRFAGTALFTASATQGAAGKIVVDTGNDQIGSVGQALPKPFIAVVVDGGNNRLGGVDVTFSVRRGGGHFAGSGNSITVRSDSDGRVAATLTLGADEGNANNVVDANFDLSTGVPATFTASARTPGDPVQTTISGVVLDNSNVPIPGVTVRAVLTSEMRTNLLTVVNALAVETNGQGQFFIPQAPVGLVKLMVDGTTATAPGKFPALEYDLVTVAGRNNDVGQPIFMLPLAEDDAHSMCVGPDKPGGTLTNLPDAPGFALSFVYGQVTFPGGSKTGCVSVTVVHGDKVPMTPGFGQQPRFIVTIQPAGAVFNPPAAITMPNVDGLKPRQVTEMYSFDHDIGSFVAIGTGIVSDDGLVVRSSPGVGVLKAGWHCGGDPTSTGSTGSISVSISPTSVTKKATETADFTATGDPPEDGTYSWELVEVQPGDDKTVASLVASPSCANQPTCVATIKGEKPGTVTLRVTFTCTTTGATATAEAGITITVDTMIKELTYSGGSFHDVAKDKDGTNYPAPQWKDANDNGNATDPGDNRFPVSYTRNGTVTLTAMFRLSHAVNNADAKVTGDGNGLHFETTVGGISGTTFTTSAMTSSGNLPNTIKKMNPLQIDWKVSFDKKGGYPAGSFQTGGASDNVAHITLGDPTTSPLYETVLDIGTRNADGVGTEAAAVSAIWSDFQGRNVKRVEGSMPAVTMRYWNPVLNVCQSVAAMLADPIGNGSCVAWSQVFNRTLKAQGIAGSQILEIQANTAVNAGADGFLVKNWRFGRHIRTGPNGVRNSAIVGDDVNLGLTGPDQPAIGPGPNGILDSVAQGDDTVQDGYFAGTLYPYFTPPPQGDAVDQPGIPGQFNPDPPGGFFNHFVVRYNGQIWDPSYGAGPFASENAHENAAADGISAGQRAKKNGAAQELQYTASGLQ